MIWTNLSEEAALTRLDELREEGVKWRAIARDHFRWHNHSTIYKWYRNRRKEYDAQKSLRDFDLRLRMLEETLIKSFVPPPPPPSSPLHADASIPPKQIGTQIHNSELLTELKEVSALFKQIKEESKSWIIS